MSDIEREQFLDHQDPLRHLRSPDADDVLVPAQPPSILNQRADLLIPGVSPGDPGITVKLALDAAPGCGGIAWPAGEASSFPPIKLGRLRKLITTLITGPRVISSPERPLFP